jgi:hypothetical protein
MTGREREYRGKNDVRRKKKRKGHPATWGGLFFKGEQFQRRLNRQNFMAESYEAGWGVSRNFWIINTFVFSDLLIYTFSGKVAKKAVSGPGKAI